MSLFDAILQGDGKKKKPVLYELLGCDKFSTQEQLIAEYRAKVRDLHPDKVGDNAELHRKFVQFQDAYTILSDPGQRRVYDLWLESPLPMSFVEFKKNSDAIRTSMHWVTPKATPALPTSAAPTQCGMEQPAPAQPSISRWRDGRYQSDAARRFRNYEI